MNLILHIGQSKTGTSAIQSFLTRHTDTLRDHGVIYPSPRVWGMPLDLVSHNAVADSLYGFSRYPHLTADQYFSQFSKDMARTGGDRLILSAEHFFGGEPRIWDLRDEAVYMAGYREKLQRLRKYTAAYRRVTVVLYLRPQVDWLASVTSQMIRYERLHSSDAIYQNDRQLFELLKPIIRFDELLRHWVEIAEPAEIIVVPYNRANIRGGSSVTDFLFRIGLESIDFGEDPANHEVHSSLAPDLIEVKKRINSRPRSKIEERIIIDCLNHLSKKRTGPSTYRFDDELLKDVEQYVEAGNRYLNENYLTDEVPFVAVSEGYQNADQATTSQEETDCSMQEFEALFSRRNTVMARTDLRLRSFLRNKAVPVHTALHQLKRCFRNG